VKNHEQLYQLKGLKKNQAPHDYEAVALTTQLQYYMESYIN
jgi:hypothetical protein